MEDLNNNLLSKSNAPVALAEKSFDSARNFLGKLIMPLATEVGLLIMDPIRLWRLKNQVAILNKAKEICEKGNIKPKAISVKLIAPLLENASLEEDEELQNRWSILLANLVDSNQNIENHVFPYILGQISRNEFSVIEAANKTRLNRVRALQKELEIFLIQQPLLVKEAELRLSNLTNELQGLQGGWTPEWSKLHDEKKNVESELSSLKRWREMSLKSKIKDPEKIPEGALKEYELSNLIRLGLVKEVTETLPHSQEIEIPRHDKYSESPVTVDLEVEIESEQYLILTQLGELFLDACTLKNGGLPDSK